MRYEITNVNTNETEIVKFLREVEAKIGMKVPNISFNFKQNLGEFTYKEWKVKRLLSEKKTRHKYPNGCTFDKIIQYEMMKAKELQRKRKEMIEWKCRESFKEENIQSETEKSKQWEEHCKETCTKSKDGKVYIPNSLLKEFPRLEDFTLPKSMQ